MRQLSKQILKVERLDPYTRNKSEREIDDGLRWLFFIKSNVLINMIEGSAAMLAVNWSAAGLNLRNSLYTGNEASK